MLFLSHPDFAFLVWCLQFLVRVVQNLRSSLPVRPAPARDASSFVFPTPRALFTAKI